MRPSVRQRSGHSHKPVVQDFLQWVDCNPEKGTSGMSSSITQPFVSRQRLKDYFKDEDRTQAILDAVLPDGEQTPESSVILEDWVQVFAILLYIDRGQYIGHFTRREELSDSRLPFTSKPDGFPSEGPRDDFFRDFQDHQWKFSPWEFRKGWNNNLLHERRILPICFKEEIGSGGSATLYAIKIHRDCDHLQSYEGSSGNEESKNEDMMYAMKTYNTDAPDAKKYYDNEIAAFSRVGPCETLVTIYGSFQQTMIEDGPIPTFNVLLEYANGGTLETFFQQESGPWSSEDTIKFWSAIFGVSKALHAIHQVQQRGFEGREGPEIFHGWHQDVKPSNILVFKRGDNAFDSTFKLADLGLSHFQNSVSGQDARGTREYGAPELYRGNEFLASAPLGVKQGADMWSLGCILSEAVTWSVAGRKGLEDYRQRRRAEAEQIPDFKDPGCFHDEEQVLRSVSDTHKRLVEGIRKSDFIAEEVLKLVEDLLARDVDVRLTAKQIIHKTDRIIEAAKMKPRDIQGQSEQADDQPLPSTPPPIRAKGSLPPTLVGSPASPPFDTPITASTGLGIFSSPESLPQSPPSSPVRRQSFKAASRPAARPLPEVRSAPSVHNLPPPLPHLSIDQVLEWSDSSGILPNANLLDSLSGRDFVFLIDDSHRMQPHWAQLKRAFRALAYTVKRLDRDGLEMYCMVEMKQVKSRNTTQLIDHLKQRDLRLQNDVDINRCLTLILSQYVAEMSQHKGRFSWSSKSAKPMIIYVLTAGVWDSNDNAEGPIKNFICQLEDAGLPDKHVGIQFIQFGNLEDGTAKLKRLDRLDEIENLPRDIVNTEHCTGNVWRMLLGSINNRIDDDNDDDALGEIRLL